MNVPSDASCTVPANKDRYKLKLCKNRIFPRISIWNREWDVKNDSNSEPEGNEVDIEVIVLVNQTFFL